MKKIGLIAGILFSFPLFGNAQTVVAETFSTDSILSIVAARITRSPVRASTGTYSKEDYQYSFYIEDIGNREPFYGQAGIYEFGLYGDDLDRWIMRYDGSGYKIYEQSLDTQMLGEVLEFCEKHDFSSAKFKEYILGLYRSSMNRENVGEKEVLNE